jgi:predicted signal transduction protein with EAL and GGDEF domain
VVKRRNGLDRCRYEGYVGMNRWGASIISQSQSTIWSRMGGAHRSGRLFFVEVKVDRKLIAGCADDRLKRNVWKILDLPDSYGACTVAEGVETRADFLAVREMGFDFVEGFLFAKPIPAKKFARTIMGHPMTVPQ